MLSKIGLGLLVLSTLATSAAGQGTGTLADIEVLRVKPGTESKFEATQKLHWRWHKRQGDEWSWFVWTVESGENMGAYVIASFGHPWNDLDRENQILAPTPEPEADTWPFHETVKEGYYVFRRDLSPIGDLTQPAPFASLTRVIVKPGGLADFEAALQSMSVESNRSGKQATMIRWYELVSGGSRPQFLLFEERSSWSKFGEGSVLDSLLRHKQDRSAGSDRSSSFGDSIQSMQTEALQFHPDLSKLEAAQ